MTLSEIFSFEKLKDMFDFSGVSDPASIGILIASVIVVGVLLSVLSSRLETKRGIVRRTTTKEIVYAATCVALSFLLSFIRLYRMPYGGSITLASVLPIALYCYVFGFRKGMVVCFVFALLNFCQGPYVVNAWSALFDYLLPYLSVALVGLFPLLPRDTAKHEKPLKKHAKFFVGLSCYFTLRLASHVLAAIFFWSDGIDFGSFQGDLIGFAALAYGLVYNLLFLVPDTVVVVIAAVSLFSSRSLSALLASACRSGLSKQTVTEQENPSVPVPEAVDAVEDPDRSAIHQ